MPGWDIHRKIYELLNLSLSTCSCIDEIVDSTPPLIKEMIPQYKGYERLPIHFGFSKTEFPDAYNYIYKRYGVVGVKCLMVHYVADFIENLLKRGFKDHMIVAEVQKLIRDYVSECSYQQGKCIDIDNVVKDLMNALNPYLEQIIKMIREWISKKELPLDVLVNASTDILSFLVKLELYLKGYRGKRGFTVNKQAFDRVFNKAKSMLRIKLYEALISGEHIDVNETLEVINWVRNQVTGKPRITVNEHAKLINEGKKKSASFAKFIELMLNLVKECIKEYEMEKHS